MATVREQPKPAAPARHDAVVQQQLDRARRRIRLLDVGAAALGFLAVTLAFVLVTVLLDRRYDLAPATRQIALLGYGALAAVYLVFGLARPLSRRINPYYAARELERAVPEAKNSVVNWLDLHDEPLPPVIRGAVAQRAARDLGRADLDEAIRGRHAVIAGAAALALFLAVGVVLISGGAGQFRSLLGRAFFPFSAEGIAKRTQLTLVRPSNGDAVVAVGQPVSVAVRVAGRVPDPEKPGALKLLFRYDDAEPYEEQLLEPEVGDVWATSVPAARTHHGFLYKVVGGDDETPEYRVTVRSAPLVQRFAVTYHYRPYLGWADRTSPDANLKELRGTEAIVVAHTNRAVKEGRLDREDRAGKKSLPAEMVDGLPHALRFRLVLDQEGQYRVWFTSTDGDGNTEAMPYTITVLPDQAPRAELTKPGEDVTLPANGTLKLEGSATDDFGVQALALRMRLVDGAALAPKPYRAGKSLRFTDGSYPKTIAYKDFVALDALKDEAGKPLPLAKGQVLEYWLEVLDGCDFPAPNRGESRHFKVTIAEPTPDKKKEQEQRDQAAREQKDHEKKQDEKLGAENKERQEKGEAEGAKPDKPGEGDKPNPDDGKGDADTQSQAEKIKDALDRREQEGKGADDKGAGKSDGADKGDGKADGAAKPDGDKGDGKGAGQGDTAKDAAGDKGNGGEPGAKEQGEAKGGGQSSGDGEKGETKGDPMAARGEAKSGDKKEAQGAEKKEGRGDGEAGAKGEAKAGGDKGEESATAKGESKAGKSDEVSRLEKDLQNGDDKARERAEKRLEELSRDGDAKTREEARKALDKEKDAREAAPALAKSPPKNEGQPDGSPPCAECKGGQGAESNAPCACKNGGASGNGGAAGNDNSEAKGSGKPQGDGDKQGQGKGQATAKGPSNGGGEGTHRVGDGTGTDRTADAEPERPASKPDPNHRRRAGVLQLEDFTKIDKRLLDELKMSEEELKAFREAYTKKVQRPQPTPEVLPPAQAGGDLRNLGAREVKPGDKPRTDDARRSGLGQAPPEFREIFRRYTSGEKK